MDASATQNNPEIGERIATFRAHLGLTQHELAGQVDGTKRGIQANEGGIAMPNSKMLTGLARLGANLNWILTGKGSMISESLLDQAQPKSTAVSKSDLTAAINTIQSAAKSLKVELTPDQKILLEAHEIADPAMRDALMNLARAIISPAGRNG